MKKLVSICLSAILLTEPILAADTASADTVQTSTLGENYTYSIDALVELDLLRGTGESLELDRAPTRAEAITMIVRLDGGEKAASPSCF